MQIQILTVTDNKSSRPPEAESLEACFLHWSACSLLYNVAMQINQGPASPPSRESAGDKRLEPTYNVKQGSSISFYLVFRNVQMAFFS